jgi:hypothetical protein
MTTLTKIILAIFAILMASAIGFIIYQQHEMQTMQTQLNTSLVAQKQMIDDISRSSAQYVSKSDLDAFAAANGVSIAAIQSDLKALNATISGVNTIAVNSGGIHQTGVSSSGTTPNPTPTPSVNNILCDGKEMSCPDPYGYQSNTQNLALNEPFGKTQVPIGTVGFSAWQKAPWTINTYPRTYNITNVLSTDQNGKQYVYNKFTINSNGKDYPVDITNAKFEQQVPTASLSWFNPRLIIGADASYNITRNRGEFTPNLSVGVISYGTSKAQPAWSFGEVGLGYGAVSKTLDIQISPVQYNLGQHLTFIRNTYVGPVVGVGINGDFLVGAGLRVGL